MTASGTLYKRQLVHTFWLPFLLHIFLHINPETQIWCCVFLLLCVLMLISILDPEDMGYILEMAEPWIRCSFVSENFLECSCHPSTWLSLNFSTGQKLFPSYLSHCYWHFAFFCCLQLKGILMWHICMKSGNRKVALDIYIFQETLIFLHSRMYLLVTCKHLGLLLPLLLLLSGWILDG